MIGFELIRGVSGDGFYCVRISKVRFLDKYDIGVRAGKMQVQLMLSIPAPPQVDLSADKVVGCVVSITSRRSSHNLCVIVFLKPLTALENKFGRWHCVGY